MSLLDGAVPEPVSLGLLAILQGLTEFLPVSSSGHLVLTQAALGTTGPALRLDVALHLGTLGAVLVGYRRDLAQIARDVLGGRLRELGLLFVGLFLRDFVHGLFESVRATAIGLCATSVILLLGERARRRGVARERALDAPDAPAAPGADVGVLDALLIGSAQSCAILPGISRSGSTIACGLARGLAPQAAARFSFLLAIPAILGAAVLELPDAFGADAEAGGMGPAALAVGALIAGVVGYAALRALLAFLGRGAFAWFAAYCAALGVSVLVFA